MSNGTTKGSTLNQDFNHRWNPDWAPGGKQSEMRPAEVQHGATCTRCQAWRGELGSEPIPDCGAWARGVEPCSACFVCHLVVVFRAVRRVLHPTGTVWCNLGDSYSANGACGGGSPVDVRKYGRGGPTPAGRATDRQRHIEMRRRLPPGLGPKQLMMLPARVALALQSDGWVLRSAITWAKKAPMPESVRDRPTSATEMVYLLAKNPSYYYDAEAVRQPNTAGTLERHGGPREMPWAEHKPLGTIPPGHSTEQHPEHHHNGLTVNGGISGGANLRNFWLLGPEPYSAAHFAVFPRKLVEPCILAGTSARGCCSRCRAPYERIVERGDLVDVWHRNKAPHRSGKDFAQSQTMAAGLTANGHIPGHQYERETTGWRPTCRCEGAEVIPCTVLDCFAGSGTSLYVARHHGRRAVGIELNEEYARLAADRLKQATLGLEVY